MTDLEQRRIVVLRSEGRSAKERHRNDSVLRSCMSYHLRNVLSLAVYISADFVHCQSTTVLVQSKQVRL